MQPGDQLVVVLDSESGLLDDQLIGLLDHLSARVIVNAGSLGLSHCRNQALARCSTRYILFIDDDVRVTGPILSAIRRGFQAGHQIVGPRLRLPASARMPWYITEGQLHYLGIHASGGMRTWGACMAFDVGLAREAGLTFRPELGRHRGGLQSGDDTTFLDGLRAAGASELVLADLGAVHHVDLDRFRLRTMIRRAYWQGRSEVRRRNVLRGLGKEWRRYRRTRVGWARRWALAALYTAAVLGGILVEQGNGLLRG